MNDIVKTDFDLSDIRRVQKQRKDLSDDQAIDVLGFLMDTYAIEPYNMDSDKLFKETADLMFPKLLIGA